MNDLKLQKCSILCDLMTFFSQKLYALLGTVLAYCVRTESFFFQIKSKFKSVISANSNKKIWEIEMKKKLEEKFQLLFCFFIHICIRANFSFIWFIFIHSKLYRISNNLSWEFLFLVRLKICTIILIETDLCIVCFCCKLYVNNVFGNHVIQFKWCSTHCPKNYKILTKCK